MKCIHRQIQHTALHWILSPEVPVEKPPVPLVEDLLLSDSFLHAEDQDNWLRTQLKVTEDIINTTAEKTKGQRNNAVWAIVRKLRITASNFGQVLKAARRKMYFLYFIKKQKRECPLFNDYVYFLHLFLVWTFSLNTALYIVICTM